MQIRADKPRPTAYNNPMPSKRDKASEPTPKRWRPRFSLRTLVVLVTLACCYAACWGPTKSADLTAYLLARRRVPYRTDVIAPLIIAVEEREILTEVGDFAYFRDKIEAGDDSYYRSLGQINRRYYFWFFGYVAKLPYERDVP